MKIISKSEFTELANFESDCSVTIYLPTHRAGVAVNEQQDSLAFKTALQTVRKQLQAKGFSNTDIDRVIKPGLKLLDHETFWYELSDGLGVFMANGFFKTVKLPCTVRDEILINRHFYVSPLVPLIENGDHFFLLVFSRQFTRFYRGNAFSMEQIEVEGLPYGIDDVIHFEEKGGKELFRGGGNATGSGVSFHGHSPGTADKEVYLAQYLKEVDSTLWKEALSTEKAPLVLAAVDYMVTIYKQITQYKNIWQKALIGNFELEEQNSLFRKAREIIEPFFHEEHRTALKTYYDQSATGLTSTSADEIIPASHYGRISDLFVMKDAHIWGRFDENDNVLVIHDEKKDGDDCLINKAVVKTVANGGAVHVLEPDRMPDGNKITAFMRYEIAV
ncbi:MAG TPA: hypothetical protein VGE26_02745 [Sphingobacteriaceae bacterium]